MTDLCNMLVMSELPNDKNQISNKHQNQKKQFSKQDKFENFGI
jgi:hypothetical protein